MRLPLWLVFEVGVVWCKRNLQNINCSQEDQLSRSLEFSQHKEIKSMPANQTITIIERCVIWCWLVEKKKFDVVLVNTNLQNNHKISHL